MNTIKMMGSMRYHTKTGITTVVICDTTIPGQTVSEYTP